MKGVGIWSAALARSADEGAVADAAAELEDLGYTALWLPGGAGGPILERSGLVLGATRAVPVATGILNVWMHTPDEAAAGTAELLDRHPGRFVLGIGISHAPLVDAVTDDPGRYRRPLSTMRGYLDGLDAAARPVAPQDRVIAALGPKMLELARDRSRGTHPYLTTPEHTRVAREAVGPDALVAPELTVALETDPARGREAGRRFLETYLGLPNYTNNMLRHGFTEDDLADGGSDRLVDAHIAWGDEATIRARVDEHLEAGADHVCVQVLGGDREALALEHWRALAPALTGSA